MVAAFSDAQYVAPLVQSGDLLSGGPKPASNDEDDPRRPTKTYFYVFDYQTKDGFYPAVRFHLALDIFFKPFYHRLYKKPSR